MQIHTEKKFVLARNGYNLYSNHGSTAQRWFIYYFNDIAGFKKRVKIYGGINRSNTPEGRYKLAQQLLCDLENGVYQTVSQFEAQNLQAIFNRYFDERCKTLRSKTRGTYLSKINAFINYCASKRIDQLSQINKAVSEKFIEQITKGPTTKNAYRVTLKMFFADFKKAGLTQVNPFENLKKIPESRRGKFAFSASQVSQLKTAMQSNPVLWMACQLQYYCFIRPGELRLLQMEYINLDEHFIIIPASISKNKKTQTISIPLPLEPHLRQWLAGITSQSTYILNRQAQPLNPNKLNKWHSAILKTLGYSNRYSLYSWKHTGAVNAVKSGISLKSLQMQIRHHSLDQLNEYLREMGVMDSADIRNSFPAL